MRTKIIIKTWLNIFFSFLIILQSNNILYAQSTGGKLSGKVVDAASGSPLPGVNVLIMDTNLGGVTDLEGDYFVLNVPPGTYKVRASMVGYKNIIQTNVTINVNHTTNLDFRLGETAVEIGKDVVVVSERPLIEKDETSTRHYVSATEIATRPTDQLTQVLNTMPGIDVNTGGELTVRRGSLDQVSFLIDGIRARNPVDFQPYTNVNLTSIQDLEIITGGFNAEYGEAQSGVFNIVTKDGSKNIESYSEFRWTPPGLYHWGTAFYDYSTNKYWENTHARHLQWWIDNPNQWVDPVGTPGNSPKSIWTPEQAYQNYIQTHQPLNNYTNQSGYQAEVSLGGPLFENMFFFITGKYRSAPPITGNSYRSTGKWYDATGKLTYNLSSTLKLLLSGFYSQANTGYGMENLQLESGLQDKYAYYDYAGYPTFDIDGQVLKLTNVLSPKTFYEIQFSRTFTHRTQLVFPNDPNGWETGAPQYDNLRAVDSLGNPIVGGYNDIIGLHTTGYYYQGNDKNTDLTLSGNITSQVSKTWQIKGGFGLTYYILNRFQQGKAYEITEQKVYHPYEGDMYFQHKLEFEGLIMNLGLRYDFYNPDDNIYLDIFDPFDQIAASETGTTPVPKTKKTSITGQLSPRIGISHPISDKTVLHFSYGHFFQRADFGNYGEGTGTDDPNQQVTGILNTYVISNSLTGLIIPYNLGNRQLKPRKTVAYELGIEHNMNGIVADVTAYYKDITNTIRTVRIFMSNGVSYLTTGNSNYADARGVEVSIRKPLSGLWGGYLNYSWSTGISGRSGDPDVIAAPGSGVQTRVINAIGDEIQYDPPRLKFGLTFLTPNDLSFAKSIFSDIQISLDYQVYYPHKQINSDNFLVGGRAYIRSADKNADLRVRKEINILGVKPSIFVEIRNLFNDKWVNLETVSSASPADQVRFVNSGFQEFPTQDSNGGPFPDVLQYRNLPRRIIFGFALGL